LRSDGIESVLVEPQRFFFERSFVSLKVLEANRICTDFQTQLYESY